MPIIHYIRITSIVYFSFLCDAINEFNSYICNQVLANSLQIVDEVANATTLEFDGFTLDVNVVKA